MKQHFFSKRVMLLAMLALVGATPAHAETILQHVHGLAFSADGSSLMIPAHAGLAVYRDGRWSKMSGPEHDFMGFSVANNAIYTSGHPAPASPMRNPLGLMKSTDGGKSWQPLGLSGESDFHLMAAGYRSNAVYVVNPGANSRMPQAGIYFTQDDGKTWKRSEARGLSERITSIAAHASDANTVALGTADGLYLSQDAGASFKRVGPPMAVTAVTFDFGGKHIYFAPAEGSILQRVTVDGKGGTKLPLPKLERDVVVYIAQSPTRPEELAIATRSRHVYLTTNGGKSWKQIARAGEKG